MNRLIIPKSIQEILLGKKLHSRRLKGNLAGFVQLLNGKKNENLSINWRNNEFVIEHKKTFPRHNSQSSFHGRCMEVDGSLIVEGKFKYDFSNKVIIMVFSVLIIAAPFLTGDVIFGIVVSYLLFHIFGFFLYLFDILNRGKELEILSLLKMNEGVDGGSR